MDQVILRDPFLKAGRQEKLLGAVGGDKAFHRP
jgi:hypothetical protein